MARPFKLEAVLTHRRYREDTARQRLAAAARELSAAREKLAQQEKVRQEYRQALRLKQENSGSVAELMMYTRYLGRLDEAIEGQRRTVKDCAAAKEALRRELMIRLKERKVIERLKERHQAEEEKSDRDREQKMMAEIAVNRYQRRR